MTSLGFGELVLIGIVLLIAVGPERLPKVTRDIGRLYGRMRRAADDLRRALVLEADRMDEEDRLKELRRKRLEAEEARKKAQQQTGAQAQPPPDAPPEPPSSEGEAVAAGPDAEQAAAPSDPHAGLHHDGPPPGFTEEDWAEIPPHVREKIQRRRRES